MTEKLLRTVLLSTLIISFSGCTASLRDFQAKSPDESAIKTLLIRWETTWNNHDVEGNLGLWHKDAKIMYGKDRKIASKEKYTKVLPDRMKANPSIRLGRPNISVKGATAEVEVTLTINQHRVPTTFHLVRENDNWLILSWEY